MLMLCVTTLGDPITARAKMDFTEMEKLAEVTVPIYCVSIYHRSNYKLKNRTIHEKMQYNAI